MRNFEQKRGWRNILQSRPILVLLGILVIIFAYGVIGFMGKIQVTRENRKIAENKIAELKQEKDKLTLDIAKLKTDEGVEESIRDKFGLAKEGEGMVVVVENKNKIEIQDTKSGGFFSFFRNLFN
ncbi:hypothetical protein A3C60_01120 [Candidatus Nomurabacteria bacterium RIFCSPHIGHO2_02_FULL_37_45]|uniref:Cell division protein FtsL n=2 Tax=Candidatus Nomuraibacteriota TaxID=1752729 RepID=A0A1F6Y787_9BACT|nr:MAG: hypothetical protein A2727_01785 [Candidatus Nomurabacteria bacterium RIFCSPHIGHO2_01_FULL_37_110]OGI71243.1 MAG: hypothetical protein A3C60_01120 [Candidatus Nomurabacteria bacterium RIFCSPHIGHO2_02_FULL_37_45]OGI79300.1 MAG: hypothetical protein A3F19_02245 [Candidatus Nomurabacteria bacterium RIFCSPHIGHO2_12_FULL_37_29]OGI84849.1 MAG: hypothetical protein A3A92_00755 [Candidatus Nomurabacteria bacterium RIFCSPLOWO2_01_FULL_37_49]OGJ02240.1 MAG: hypothetical protein A3G98_01475 [Candi